MSFRFFVFFGKSGPARGDSDLVEPSNGVTTSHISSGTRIQFGSRAPSAESNSTPDRFTTLHGVPQREEWGRELRPSARVQKKKKQQKNSKSNNSSTSNNINTTEAYAYRAGARGRRRAVGRDRSSSECVRIQVV